MFLHRRFSMQTVHRIERAWGAFMLISWVAFGLIVTSPITKPILTMPANLWVCLPFIVLAGMILFTPVFLITDNLRTALYQRVENRGSAWAVEELWTAIPEEVVRNQARRDYARAARVDLHRIAAHSPKHAVWAQRFEAHPSGLQHLHWRDTEALKKLTQRLGLPSEVTQAGSEDAEQRRRSYADAVLERYHRRYPESLEAMD